MRYFLSALALSLGTVSVSVAASEPQAAPSDTAKPKKEKRICRTIQKTGSRMGARTCKTQEAWDTLDQNVDPTDLQVKADGYQPN